MPSASDVPARADARPSDAPSSERMSSERTASERTASERVPSEVALPGAQGALTERDRRILALEGRTFRYVGAKERAIREEIGLSKVAYYVRLNALLDEPAALRAAPAVVNRLRARRTSEDGGASLDGDHRVA